MSRFRLASERDQTETCTIGGGEGKTGVQAGMHVGLDDWCSA